MRDIVSSATNYTDDKDMLAATESVNPDAALHESDPEIIAQDDVSGERLDLAGVRAARKEEIAYLKSMKVYEKCDVSEAWDKTGKGPIAVRWIDTNKTDAANPLYRSRLVAK